MKKVLFTIIILAGILINSYAATVNINIVGFSFSPNNVTVNVGDVININTNSFHPTTQVSQATWNANGITPIANALFTSQISTITFSITADMAGTTIYYVCENHVALNGMKGQIVVNVATGLEENAVKEFNFTIYPNPVKNNSALNISLKRNDNVDMRIFGSDGKLVSNYLQQKMNAGEYTLRFDAGKLETGIYIIQLKTSQGILRKQILVTH